MSKSFILVCDGMDKKLFSELSSNPKFEVYPEAKNSQETIAEIRKKAHGMVIRSATCPDKEFLQDCPNLKYIIRAGEGTDNIDKAACAELGIKVSNTPGANNNSAAEHALALMMTVLRKTALANTSMHSGKWEKASFTGNELTNKTIGIVGFGRIGQLLAKRLIGFDPKILFFDPIIDTHSVPYDNIQKVHSVEDIFKSADIISIHTPLNNHTRNMVNYQLLSSMKSNAILVNAARGNIVVEEDLVKALKEGKLKGAALDVFSSEPLAETSPLLGIENLVLTPHLGGSTDEAQFRVGEMAVHQLNEFFVNGNLLNEVKA
ncbi:MAG: hydroxyacid dehydrogenase [Halobacteriovoraceae bacterium]|nr:hydroxyacid dehydrogenase [Halobacteriovoraceae bacterium]MCB9094220.1 hydroxyacid dehydrogenase [Halobacteriovoraceae bacterium]